MRLVGCDFDAGPVSQRRIYSFRGANERCAQEFSAPEDLACHLRRLAGLFIAEVLVFMNHPCLRCNRNQCVHNKIFFNIICLREARIWTSIELLSHEC